VLGWSGERVIGPGSPVAQIRFADRATLWSVAADPRVSFGDAIARARADRRRPAGPARNHLPQFRGRRSGGRFARLLQGLRYRPAATP